MNAPGLAMRRSGQEVAMAAMVVYQEHQSHGLDENTRELSEDSSSRRPISASEVEEASNLVFRRSSTASEHVFNPNLVAADQAGGGSLYPRLRRNQALGNEVLAMGHRLARHPGVQAIIMDDIMAQRQQNASVTPRLRARGGSVRRAIPYPQGRETGFAQLVDILSQEEGVPAARPRGDNRRRDASRVYSRDDDAEEAHEWQELMMGEGISPETRDLIEEVAESVDDEQSQCLAQENESSSEETNDLEPRCTCRECNMMLAGDAAAANAGTCWKDVQADYECQICFDVLVGVHVLDNCGHHFCGSCMERWMGNALQGECPVCRAPVNKLVPVLKMDEMIAKAVAAAAPGKERTAWYERRAAWERKARRRRESMERARIATEVASNRAAEAARTAARSATQASAATQGGEASEAETNRPNGGTDARRGRSRRRDGRGRRQDSERGDGFDGFATMSAVVAVAVLLVVTVMKIRRML